MKNLKIAIVALLASTGIASAQVPVFDGSNFQKSTEIANTTQQILETDQQIMEFTKQTLAAVTGQRTSEAGQLANMALGSGFQMGQAPSFGSILSGGAMSFAGLGSSSQGIVSQLINGLQLVQTLSGLLNGEKTAFDQSYSTSVNMATTLSGLVDSTQGAISTRSQAFTSGAQQIGTAQDLKGSIDQNSQIQVQTGQTVNELIGVMNGAVAASNQENLDRLAAQSQAVRALQYNPQ